MIKRLRHKLIAACMASLAVVLLVILGGVNLMGYYRAVSDADAILTVLAANDGTFPEPRGGLQQPPPGEPGMRRDLFDQRGMSPETPYESRFFSVLLGEDGQVLQTDTGQIAAVDAEDAAACAQSVVRSGRGAGFWGDYRYLRCDDELGSRVIFLDCGRSLSSFRTTLLASILLALFGLAAVLVLLLILSKHIVRPVAESYEKQKQFITDAGHELKTPMTIISADADLAEMECGENQWLTDIRRQARRLTELTNDLIYLSRMEEEQPKLQCIEFPISDVAEEMAGSFQGPAKSQEKDFSTCIQPMLSFTGDEKNIRKLISILLDNALKYSPRGRQDGAAAGKAGARPAADRIQHRRAASGAGEAVPSVRPVLPDGPVPQQSDRRLRPGAVHRPEHRAGPQRKDPGGESGRSHAVGCGASSAVNGFWEAGAAV